MNTKSLEYFIKVVEKGCFTKAAEELFISQSAISQQIKSLEEELGYPLMIRNKKGFELTQAGKYIFLEGKNILNNIKEVSNHAAFISNNQNQGLRIGYVVNFGYHEIKKALMQFSEKYPEVKLSVKGGTHEVVSLSNLNDITDILIGDQRKKFSDKYNNIELGNLYYTIRVSNSSSLSHKNEIKTNDLKGYSCILICTKEEAIKEIEFTKTTFGFDGDYIFANSLTEANIMVAANIGFLPTASKVREKMSDDSITSIPFIKDNEVMKTKLYGYYKKSFDETLYEKLIVVLKEVMK